MDIWLKVNVSISCAVVFMLFFEKFALDANKIKTPKIWGELGGFLILALICSWPLYWLVLVWI